MSGFDDLGRRMKEWYEFRARPMLPRRTHTIIRLDGRSFSSYTRDLERPYDARLMADMAAVAEALCREVMGCRLAYTQSDEISLILTDFATPQTDAWFGGNQQKIVSISAALATAVFNELRPGKRALFDSRVFTMPDPAEVISYLHWRQADATRNSIQMAAQARFSPRELHGKGGGELQEMLWTRCGVNWNDYDPRFRRGTVVAPLTRREPVTYTHGRTGETHTTPAVERRAWTAAPAPRFTRHRDWLAGLLAGEHITTIPDDDAGPTAAAAS